MDNKERKKITNHYLQHRKGNESLLILWQILIWGVVVTCLVTLMRQPSEKESGMLFYTFSISQENEVTPNGLMENSTKEK